MLPTRITTADDYTVVNVEKLTFKMKRKDTRVTRHMALTGNTQ